MRASVRLILLYAINSTVFIRFFSNLFSVFIFMRTQTLLKMGYIRPSVRPSVRRAWVRLFVVYAINSTVFIRFFSNLFSVFILMRTRTLLKMGYIRPSVRPSVCASVRLLFVYAINSTVFIRFFLNLFSVFILMRTRTLLKMGYIRPSVRACVDFFLFTP